jgi:hypothetical protein
MEVNLEPEVKKVMWKKPKVHKSFKRKKTFNNKHSIPGNDKNHLQQRYLSINSIQK